MHTIAPYKFSISDSNRPIRDRFCNFQNIRGKSLTSLFKSFIESLNSDFTYSLIDRNKHAFRFSECTISEGKIYGFIESGGSGKKGKIIDTTDSTEIANYTSIHANTTRKFFLLTYESDAKFAFLYLHQISGEGAKTQLLQQLNLFFKNNHQALTPIIETLTFENALKKWQNEAIIKEIRGYHIKSQDDSSDMFNGLRDNHRIEVICKPPGIGLHFGKLGSLPDKDDVKSLVAISDEEPNEVKVKLELDGKPKIMTLYSQKLPICTIDFDSRSVEIVDGEPKIDSILKFCEEIGEGMAR